MGFDEKRIRSSVDKLLKAKGKGSQVRIESFFAAKPSTNPPKAAPAKRKEAPAKGGKGAPAAAKKKK
jgi:hypothetical protein